MTNIKELSEGEEFIEEFFIDEQIKYETQKQISNLKWDNKEFRISDFYLPKFDLHIEFFGQWNVSEEHRQRYRDKRKVYELNEIPCVYLYPENLGILKYVFNYRVKRELERRGKRKELLKFNYYIFNQNNWFKFPIAIAATGYILHLFNILDTYFTLLFLILVGILGMAATYDIIQGLIYYLITDVKRIKKLNKKD